MDGEPSPFELQKLYSKLTSISNKQFFANTKNLALKGDPEALFNLASYYEQGVGTKPNKQKAFNLYKLSAENGFLPACFSLARCYQLGIGVSKSLSEAIKNYNICIENGYATEECALKIYYCRLEMDGYPSALNDNSRFFSNADEVVCQIKKYFPGTTTEAMVILVKVESIIEIKIHKRKQLALKLVHVNPWNGSLKDDDSIIDKIAVFSKGANEVLYLSKKLYQDCKDNLISCFKLPISTGDKQNYIYVNGATFKMFSDEQSNYAWRIFSNIYRCIANTDVKSILPFSIFFNTNPKIRQGMPEMRVLTVDDSGELFYMTSSSNDGSMIRISSINEQNFSLWNEFASDYRVVELIGHRLVVHENFIGRLSKDLKFPTALLLEDRGNQVIYNPLISISIFNEDRYETIKKQARRQLSDQ